ncbi:MAG: hypothetical protein LBT94_00135 [Prevotellaceae bacterium]|jgi:hypothetical protein|nr:hypothetical protein [Prevotellaceae bacterium]
MLESTGEKYQPLTTQQAEYLITAMEQSAVKAPMLELTPENWEAEFGKSGIVSTPLGEVKMGENQYSKMHARGRAAEFGMVKPTLTSPSVIIEEASREGSVVNERCTNLLFVKTFTDSTGSKYIHFESVTISKGKKEVAVSSHIVRPQQLLDKLKAGQVVYTATALNASGQTFAEYSPQTESGALSDSKGME